MRLLAVGTLQFTAHKQVEFLIGAAQFDIGFERHRIVSLRQRVKQFMHGDGLFFLKTFVEVLALEHLRDRHLGSQTNPDFRFDLVEPFAVEAHLGLERIENLVDLRHVGLRVAHDLFGTERRAGGRASGGISNHAGEIANQEDDRVPEILKMFQLPQKDGVAEV